MFGHFSWIEKHQMSWQGYDPLTEREFLLSPEYHDNDIFLSHVQKKAVPCRNIWAYNLVLICTKPMAVIL